MIDWNKLRNAFFKECTEDKGGGESRKYGSS